MEELSRRQALTLAAAATATCACCALGAEEDKKDAKAPPPKSLSIGKRGEYDKDGYYDKFRDDKVFIVRVDGKLVAMSAICTHKRCALKVNEDTKTARCPCHKSTFSEHGTPTEGPAKVALPRYAISENAEGVITVDTTQSYAEREWENPKASIALAKG